MSATSIHRKQSDIVYEPLPVQPPIPSQFQPAVLASIELLIRLKTERELPVIA